MARISLEQVATTFPSPGPPTGEPLDFCCPRCRQQAAERFYGPCAQCRERLRAEQAVTAGGGTGGERSRFEPKMNVVPNHVATKDD